MSRLQLVHKGPHYVNKCMRIFLSLLTRQQAKRLTSINIGRQRVCKKQAKFQRRKGRKLRLNFSWFRERGREKKKKRETARLNHSACSTSYFSSPQIRSAEMNSRGTRNKAEQSDINCRRWEKADIPPLPCYTEGDAADFPLRYQKAKQNQHLGREGGYKLGTFCSLNM